MPSLKDLEDAIERLEDSIAQTIPQISNVFRRLGDDLSRYGPPQMPEFPSIPIPAGPFASIPPPAPPLPSSISNIGANGNGVGGAGLGGGSAVVAWAGRHRVVATLVGIGGVGVVGYAGWTFYTAVTSPGRGRKAGTGSGDEKRQVVVLLGGDTPHGTALAVDLESQGYIVVASVSTPESVSGLEKKGKGYIKALVLDPTDPASTSPFLRSLQSTLSLRFPLTPGDPYTTTPSLLPNVVSIISLLALPGTEASPRRGTAASTESVGEDGLSYETGVVSLDLAQSYLPHLISAHIVPLNVIQRSLPLLRSSQKKGVSNLSIIVALRGGARSIGATPRDAGPAMSDSAMAKACEVLRRDVKSTPELARTRVVVIDVGEITFGGESAPGATTTFSHLVEGCSPRKPTHGSVFTKEVIRVVRGGRLWLPPIVAAQDSSKVYLLARSVLVVGCTSLLVTRDWWRGDRFSVGAGAGTYSCTRALPTRLVDSVLLFPRRLASLTNWVREEAVAADKAARRRAAERRRKGDESSANSSPGLRSDIVLGYKAPLPSVVGTSPATSSRSLSGRSTKAKSVAGASDVESTRSEAENSVDSGSEADDHRHLDASWVSLKDGADSATGSMIHQPTP